MSWGPTRELMLSASPRFMLSIDSSLTRSERMSPPLASSGQERFAVGRGHEGQPPAVLHDIAMKRVGVAAKIGRHLLSLPGLLAGRAISFALYCFRRLNRSDGSFKREVGAFGGATVQTSESHHQA